MTRVEKDKKERTSMWLSIKVLEKVRKEAIKKDRSVGYIINEKLKKIYDIK